MNSKTPTLKEKVAMYEDYLHRMNMCIICSNDEGMGELIGNADNWSYQHRRGNGELSEREQQKAINEAFWKLCDTPNADKIVAERQKKYEEAKKELNPF